jgi:hypothetical protein
LCSVGAPAQQADRGDHNRNAGLLTVCAAHSVCVGAPAEQAHGGDQLLLACCALPNTC